VRDIVLAMTTISLTVLDDDLGTADRLARELRAELLGLDVSRKVIARDGDRSLEIVGPTTAQTSKVIDEFFDRPE
jgi:hypothetical protein